MLSYRADHKLFSNRLFLFNFSIREDLCGLLTPLRKLNKKGLFIFDVWYSPCVNRQQPEIRIKKVKNNEIEVFRIAEPENISNLNQVKIKYSIFVKSLKTKNIDMFEEVHEMRHFSIPEIATLAEQNSLKVLSVEEFLTAKPASINSFGVCFVLEKN